MPLIDSDVTGPSTSPALRVSVAGSVAIELDWALSSGARDDYRRDHAVLGSVYDRHPELSARVESMWGPGEEISCRGFMELMVIAHHGGLLFSTDADLLLDRLDSLCATAPATPEGAALWAETPEDRAAVLARLRRLRDSPECRHTYVDLVRDMWAAVGPDWERSGRRAVEAAVAARRDLQAKGADWHEVARSQCDLGDLLDRTVADLRPGGELVVVPAFYTHRGMLIDLPGIVIVGVRTDNTGAQARVRTEALARRLKAISDPTRLAMLDALRNGPLTVSQIATTFSLAQPTVSNHVKVLRDAGLVTDQREGTRRYLTVQHEMVQELLGSLHDVLSERAVGSQLSPVP